MSSRFSRSSEVAHLVANVRRLSSDQILETYGIEINEQGVIWDTLYEKEFSNIRQWAVFTVDQESLNDEHEEENSKWNDDDN